MSRAAPLRLRPALAALLAVGLGGGAAGPALALSSYAVAAQDDPGSDTGAASVALGVPDYAFVGDAGLGFGGTNTDVFGPGESTVLVFPQPLLNVPGQEDLLVSAFVGGQGATDSALVQVDVSSDGASFANVAVFDTASGRTTYPLRQERAFESVKHFAVDFGSQDLVTHVRLAHLGGTAEGLRLDAVEGLHPLVESDAAFEIRFERYRPDFNQRFLVRIKNLARDGGLAIREFRIDRPTSFPSTLEHTDESLFGLDGELRCVENCIPDNGPLIPFTRMAWSLDGETPAPAGLGLDPGRQAAHSRDRNFDLDTLETTYLSGYTFTITFVDGSSHGFDYDLDVEKEIGSLYQKYQYFSSQPQESGPRPVDYYEFASVGPACENGLDDDGDGLADHPQDPGCGAPTWPLEAPECDDGLDNDADGAIDDADADCVARHDLREGPPARGCGIGFELALLMPLLAARARCRARG